jgi:hypothetical protein
MGEGDDQALADELLVCGGELWSSVKCDMKRDCVVVYARLCPHPCLDIDGALAESERLLKSVLERRLDRHKTWVAAVQWSNRLSKTIVGG